MRDWLLEDFRRFTMGSGIRLRNYQEEAALAILQSVFGDRGSSFVVMFPRQSGKNELQAQIEAYLLALYSNQPVEIIKVSPTWRPQAVNAMRRLERVLNNHPHFEKRWGREYGYIYRFGQASITFLSGSPQAHIVGATANTLLEVDEAQDVGIDKFDKDIAPMAASTNATRVFWGTAWTSTTLLARELRAARRLESRQERLAFVRTADEVAQEVAAYGRFVRGQVARLGRDHPMVRTQFYCEEIDDTEGMFPAGRLALMQGLHPRQRTPAAGGGIYCLLVDVGGEERRPEEPSGRRDATAVTVVEVDLSTLSDPLLRAPRYRALDRQVWVGLSQVDLYNRITGLARLWQAHKVVVDATGLGAGLAAFLEKALPGRVLPFMFTSASKSRLGWNFLALVDAGRWQDWAGSEKDSDQALFFQQARYCKSEIAPGPGRELRWGVPDGTRDPLHQHHLHDDLLLSAALVCLLDEVNWQSSSPALVIRGRDPLADLDKGF